MKTFQQWGFVLIAGLIFGLCTAGCGNKDGVAPPPTPQAPAAVTTGAGKAPPPTAEDEAAERRIQTGASKK